MNHHLANDLCPIPMARWRSPFLALLWKEWRQQRWIFLILAFLPPLLIVFARGEWDWAFAGGAAMSWLALAILLGTNAFAANQDADSSTFGCAVPVTRARIFWTKSVMTVALLVLAAFMSAPLYVTFTLHFPFPKDVVHLAFPLVICCALLLSMVTALISLIFPDPMRCVVASIVASAPFLVWTFAMAVWSAASSIGVEFSTFHFLLVPIFGFLVAMLLARWLWCGSVHRRFTKRVLGVAAGLAGVILALASPLLLQIIHFASRANISDYMDRPHLASIAAQPSPTGRHVLLECSNDRWNCARLAWLDVEDQEVRWIDRYHGAGAPLSYGRISAWSPDGDRCIVLVSDSLSGPHQRLPEMLRLFTRNWTPWWQSRAYSTRILLPESGATKRLTELVPELDPHLAEGLPASAGRIRWFDSNTLVIVRPPGTELVFVDLTTGKVSNAAC